MDDALKDLLEAKMLIKGVLQNTVVESNKWRNEEANKLKDCVDRAYNRVLEYNEELIDLNNIVQGMADNLKEE